MDFKKYPKRIRHIAGIILRNYPEFRIKIVNGQKLLVYVNAINSIEVTYTNELDVNPSGSAALRTISPLLGAIVQGINGGINDDLASQIYIDVYKELDEEHEAENLKYFEELYPIHHRTRVFNSKRNLILLAAIAAFIAGLFFFNSSYDYYSPSFDSSSEYGFYNHYQDPVTQKYGIVELKEYTENIEDLDSSQMLFHPAVFTEISYLEGDLVNGVIDNKGVLTNIDGEIIYPKDAEHAGDVINSWKRLLSDCYGVSVITKEGEDITRIIDSKGNVIIDEPDSYFLVAISENEIKSGRYIYNVNDGTKRLSTEGYLSIYYKVSIALIVAIAIGFMILRRRKRAKGELF